MTAPEFAMAPVVDGRADWQRVQAERFGSDARQPTYEPAVDAEGEALWIAPAGWVIWTTPDFEPRDEGWRRLHVRTDGGGR